MYELKTKLNDASVEYFLHTIENQKKREDCFKLIDLMRKVTNWEPKMWGTAIVGFGSYHYKYASGHEGDSTVIGFSPRKANITIYLLYGAMIIKEFQGRMGKLKTGKGCIYMKDLSDIDENTLMEMLTFSFTKYKEHYE